MEGKKKQEKISPNPIKRRDFIRTSALTCCALNVPLAVHGIAEKNRNFSGPFDIEPSTLAAYCGIYCGACDVYQKRILKAGKELKEVLGYLNMDEISTQVPGLEGYPTFEKVLNTLMMFFGQCAGCQKGGGNPQCLIRICCKEKGYSSCAECPSAPCEKFSYFGDSQPMLAQNLKDIKESGIENWSRQQQKKVEEGYHYSQAIKKI
ncbi:MAG: DUF3795 domain-containing protein [Candidatus Aminicenantes bacterium]|nr:DUF3795 domain-containing protein [Candidatus Aminicenantes bacterium]